MKIIIASVPGSGKTTILKFVKQKIPEALIVNMGDLVFDIAKKKFNIKDRDELRKKLSVEDQHYIQETVAKKIVRLKSKILLLDTHLSIETPSGYFPGLSEKIIHILKPDAIAIIEFPAEDILERRKKDTTRKRELETLEKIEEHQKINREFAVSLATHAEAAVEIVEFKERQRKNMEHAYKAAEQIIKIIKANK